MLEHGGKLAVLLPQLAQQVADGMTSQRAVQLSDALAGLALLLRNLPQDAL